MDGIDVFHPAKIEGSRPAEIHRVSVFDTLLAKPDDDFIIGDDGGVGSFGNFNRVGDMVGVTVRNENVVGLDLIDLDVAGEWIRRNKWIEEERFASNFHRKARVTVVGKLHCRRWGSPHSTGPADLPQGERLARVEIFLVKWPTELRVKKGSEKRTFFLACSPWSRSTG